LADNSIYVDWSNVPPTQEVIASYRYMDGTENFFICDDVALQARLRICADA
jgi:hypothetical protein